MLTERRRYIHYNASLVEDQVGRETQLTTCQAALRGSFFAIAPLQYTQGKGVKWHESQDTHTAGA